MGMIYEDLVLKNSWDVTNAHRGIISESQIRQVNVNALVDTGAFYMIITEEVCKELGLEKRYNKVISLADNKNVDCKITEPVEIHWKDRVVSMDTYVLPGSDEVLMGALPLEAMDLIIDPKNQRLIGAHGDEMLIRVPTVYPR